MGTSGEATGLNLLPASDAGLGTLEGRLVRNAESASGCWVHLLSLSPRFCSGNRRETGDLARKRNLCLLGFFFQNWSNLWFKTFLSATEEASLRNLSLSFRINHEMGLAGNDFLSC